METARGKKIDLLHFDGYTVKWGIGKKGFILAFEWITCTLLGWDLHICNSLLSKGGGKVLAAVKEEGGCTEAPSLETLGRLGMTCVYSFPNSEKNRCDSEESDPIDSCVVSMHTPSCLLVYRKDNTITSFSFLLPDLLHFLLSRWRSKSNTFRSGYLLKLALFSSASGTGELSRIILQRSLLLALRELKQSVQSLDTLLFYSLSTLQFAEGFSEITFNCWAGKVPAAASLQKKQPRSCFWL